MSVEEIEIVFPSRIESKIERGHGCWFWKGARANGYGYVRWKGKVEPAHRVVYRILRGPIPEGKELDHLCRNRPCVNPDHLESVTSKQNTLRGEGATAKNARKTHCKHGHRFTRANTYIIPSTGHRQCNICYRRITGKNRRANA